MGLAVTAAASGLTAALLTFTSAVALRAALRGRRRAAATGRLVTLPGVPPPRTTSRPAVAAPEWLGRCLAEAGVDVPPADALRRWATVTALAVGAAVVAAGPGAAALAGVVSVAGPCLAWRLVRHRGAARVEAALPAAVEAAAAGLRSGASLRQALAGAADAVTGALAGDLAAVAAATERGAGVTAALERWAARRPLPGVRLVVAALCLGAETGGAAAQAVDGVALTLRQRLAAQAEAKALATQARVSALVIGASPVVFCALAAATDPRTAGFLLRTPAGLALLATGLTLDAAGALWMARLTRVEA
jgi:tight adherence protein B